MSREQDIARIDAALQQAAEVLLRHAKGDLHYEMKSSHSPVTAADHEVDALLRRSLPQPGDGWLSEETVDDQLRLGCRRVWIVDPLDGTRDFVAQRPEYSISIALVEDGEPVLGGVCNPATGVTVIGGPGLGIEARGESGLQWPDGEGLRVLASRSEWKRGAWAPFAERGLRLLPVGSVAYKLALVAAGAADATWTQWPKNEWDLAAGFALVRGASGMATVLGEPGRKFNLPQPGVRGAAAATRAAAPAVRQLLALPQLPGAPPQQQ